MNVLIAEDDALTRLMLQRAVEHQGHACLVAQDGLQAHQAERPPLTGLPPPATGHPPAALAQDRGRVRECASHVRLHLASSHPGQPL